MRLPLLLLLAAACGNAGAGAAFTLIGTVRGQEMLPRDAISAEAAVSFTSGTAPAAAIVLSDAASLCASVGANREPKSARALLLFLSEVDPASGALRAPSGTGRFEVFVVGSGVPPARFAVASFGANDASCREIAAESAAAVSGSVTLTANADGAYAGTFDLSFDGGDHVSGSFQTAACRGLVSYLSSVSHSCG